MEQADTTKANTHNTNTLQQCSVLYYSSNDVVHYSNTVLMYYYTNTLQY